MNGAIPHQRKSQALKTCNFSDDQIRSSASAPRGSGARTSEAAATAKELLKRPHLLLEVLITQPQARITNPAQVLRGAFPCLTKKEVVTALTELRVRWEWIRSTQGVKVITVTQKNLAVAQRAVELAHGTHSCVRASDSTPPATVGSRVLSKDFNRLRIFEALFGNWGSKAYSNKLARTGVTRTLVKVAAPHHRALSNLRAKRIGAWTEQLVVDALKVLVAEGCVSIAAGSFEDLETVMLSPCKRPVAATEKVSSIPPPPQQGVNPVPLEAPPAEQKARVVVRISSSAETVIAAMRAAKIPKSGCFDGPLSFAQKKVPGSKRSEAAGTLLELIRMNLLTVEYKDDRRTPNWKTVRIVCDPDAEKPQVTYEHAFEVLRKAYTPEELIRIAAMPPETIRSILGLA